LWTITLLPFYPHGQRPQYVVFNKKYLWPSCCEEKFLASDKKQILLPWSFSL
jgi:hypothetical protein